MTDIQKAINQIKAMSKLSRAALDRARQDEYAGPLAYQARINYLEGEINGFDRALNILKAIAGETK